jgi:hypothetical protein
MELGGWTSVEESLTSAPQLEHRQLLVEESGRAESTSRSQFSQCHAM